MAPRQYFARVPNDCRYRSGGAMPRKTNRKSFNTLEISPLLPPARQKKGMS